MYKCCMWTQDHNTHMLPMLQTHNCLQCLCDNTMISPHCVSVSQYPWKPRGSWRQSVPRLQWKNLSVSQTAPLSTPQNTFGMNKNTNIVPGFLVRHPCPTMYALMTQNLSESTIKATINPTAADDRIRFHSRQPRTRIWGYRLHRLTETGQNEDQKTKDQANYFFKSSVSMSVCPW